MTWFQQAANQSAAIAAHAEAVTFVDLDFPSGHLRLHTRTGTIAWGTGSPIPQWLGVGKLGAVADVKEDAELRPNSITLTLSGVDAALVTAAMAEKYHGRAVTIYDGFLDTTTFALLATPEVKFRGLMDYMTVDLGGNTGSITVHCESELARWEKPRELLYTHESQQLLYPTDLGFVNIPVIQSRTVDWSKEGETVGNDTRGRPGGGRGR